ASTEASLNPVIRHAGASLTEDLQQPLVQSLRFLVVEVLASHSHLSIRVVADWARPDGGARRATSAPPADHRALFVIASQRAGALATNDTRTARLWRITTEVRANVRTNAPGADESNADRLPHARGDEPLPLSRKVRVLVDRRRLERR